MAITTDAPEIMTEYVNRPIEALIHDNHNRADQDEYTNASVKQLHLEAGAGAQEAFATEAVKEAAKRSYMVSTFRWLETIPYINTIITIFKNLKIPTLKRPRKHKTITGVKMIEITHLSQKILPNQYPYLEERRFRCKAGKPSLIDTAQQIDRLYRSII